MADLVPYTDADRDEVVEFLRDPPGMHVYLASRLDVPDCGSGLVHRVRGEVRGFAFFGKGHNLLFRGDSSRFVDALASEATSPARSWYMVVADWGPASEFLSRYRRRSTRRARLDRAQDYYVQRPETLPAIREPGLRRAGEDDLEELAAAAAHMSAEDFEIDPWRIDRRAVRRAVREKIRDGRSWLLREDGRLVFKIDVAARTPEGAQVEGVFTVEDRRREGVASRAVAELGHRLLAELPLVSLHVAADNLAARRAYERAGYRHEGRLRLAIFPPA